MASCFEDPTEWFEYKHWEGFKDHTGGIFLAALTGWEGNRFYEHAGYWGHWGLAKKYSDDTPGENWKKRLSKLMKRYKAER